MNVQCTGEHQETLATITNHSELATVHTTGETIQTVAALCAT